MIGTENEYFYEKYYKLKVTTEKIEDCTGFVIFWTEKDEDNEWGEK